MIVEHWEPIKEVVEAIFASYYYNRSLYHSFNLCKEIRARVINNSEAIWTDDGDIIYGILVLLYGDYGTSPRSGWIIENKEDIISCIDDILKESEAEYENMPG